MDRLERLRQHLDRIDQISNETWLRDLEARKIEELEFHDLDRTHEVDVATFDEMHANRKYYHSNQEAARYISDWIARETKGKVFLDYACGSGSLAILAAKSGADLAIGIDISPVSIDLARTAAKSAGVADRTVFVQADAENTALPTSTIDRVVCSGVLHHLDLSFAFPELRRVLVPGGKLLALEALDYNPAIKLYRMLTPKMRTEWEKRHILSLRDIRFARRFFDVDSVRYWYITSIASPHLPALAPIFRAVDSIATRIPGLQLMAWMFSFELSRPLASR